MTRNFDSLLMLLHIVSGFTALVTGAVSLTARKGKTIHKMSGRAYFWSMTLIFITGLIIAEARDNRFLFLIAFLSYYSVFAGVRAVKLKHLHKQQSPAWFDWAAGGINRIMNLLFIGFGFIILADQQAITAASVLYIGFGLGGISLSYTNLKSFIIGPRKSYHWYLSHAGNMTGGYIATITAFLATLSSRLEIPYPVAAFILPSLIGIPLLIWWQYRKEQSFIN